MRVEISYDDFVQTSEERHARCCGVYSKVYDNGYIRKGTTKDGIAKGANPSSRKELVGGNARSIRTRSRFGAKSRATFFEQAMFQDWLLKFYERKPRFHSTGKSGAMRAWPM